MSIELSLRHVLKVRPVELSLKMLIALSSISVMACDDRIDDDGAEFFGGSKLRHNPKFGRKGD